MICLFSIALISFMILVVREDLKSESSAAEKEALDKIEEVNNGGIVLSAESGFYEADILLTVSLKKPGHILYTLNGSEPEENDDNTYLYEEAIALTAGEEETVNVLKYKAVYEDGTQSETYTNTYFLGKNIDKRYDTLVMSLTAEEEELYGYESGIFVEGKLRADWLSEHPNEEITYDTPANYNVRGRESERDVHIEIFEQDGSRIISQDGGIRISGNFTRQSEQKSFKLYARSEYDEENKFRFAFFHDLFSEADGSVVGKYKTLKIRNTGNDRSEGFIRDELGMTLVKEAGFPDTQSVRPLSVYINGVYQGLYWMHSTYDQEYFEEKYGEYEGEMVVIGDGETDMQGSSNALEEKYTEEYTELYNKYSTEDLTQDAIFEELNRYIDTQNYLQYFAVEVYLANRDWPYNNLKAYRYASEDEAYEPDSVFDGRYRYLLFDVDTTMGLGSVRDTLNESQSFDTLVMLWERNYAPLFTALMERTDCRKYFASYICDLMNGAFSPENVSEVLDELNDLRANEMQQYIEESVLNSNLLEISETYVDMQMDCIKAWAEVTPEHLLEGMRQLWDMGDSYSLHVSILPGDGIKINTLEVTEPEFTGVYLTGCDTVLTAIVPEGRTFSYWEVNGESYMEEELLIDEGMLIDGSIYATLYTEDADKGLIISEVKANGKADYIVLTNVSEKEIDTRGYFLMDKENISHMNYLGEKILGPGESLLIGCRNYAGEDSFMNVNFNLKKGEEVILGHSGSGIKEKITVPGLSIEDGVYRKNLTTGKWQEERGQ
ncbi:chitobiase/beta-hexosaminidase-like protein [Kineothrix alysoides]|uniref:Chitobiase/beta-hexosaminidase-like protein n=1 Tax=Kineothrix alysoides TaxID=1469948 RepID=A0A4R1QZJ6_9FIRM|nr:chitobiase/beta-hexosaminidase-like protein [Kineothrix alysoides]